MDLLLVNMHRASENRHSTAFANVGEIAWDWDKVVSDLFSTLFVQTSFSTGVLHIM